MTDKNNNRLIVYGATWCPDCHRSRKLLDEYKVDYEWINIEDDASYADTVIELNKGMRTIPTIVFPDQTFLAEPSNADLKNKLISAKLITV